MFRGLNEGFNSAVRQERIWKAYLFVLNEALAMQIDLKQLLNELDGIDNQSLEVEKVVKK